ncbi:Retinal guanylyl cyclase 1 [Sparganum proliferum]
MESTGAAFRIHISLPFKELLDKIGGYTTEYRGTVELEGGLKMESYWLQNSKNFHKPLPTPPPLSMLASLLPTFSSQPETHTAEVSSPQSSPANSNL